MKSLILFLLGVFLFTGVFADNDDFPVLSFSEFESVLHQETNTTYIINFWATWCKPCVEELPYFEQINDEYKDKNVEVILVSLDDVNQLHTKVIPFIKENGYMMEVILLDDIKYNSWIDKVDPSWSGSIPATLIYNKNARIFLEQSVTYEELKTIIKQKL